MSRSPAQKNQNLLRVSGHFRALKDIRKRRKGVKYMMRGKIVALCVVLAVTASSMSGTKVNGGPTNPNAAEFAYRLVTVFGGQDKVLNEIEVLNVVRFLQEHLPETTAPGGLTGRMQSENNFRNTARGDMTEERWALRQCSPEEYVPRFIKKYDLDKDNAISRQELTPAMIKIIGLPSSSRDWGKRAIAKR